MLTRSAKVTSFRVTKNRAVNETASLKRPAFGKNSASALIKKIKKELVPLLATDLEGILDKTVIDKLLMVQSRPEDNKLDLLILPLPHCFFTGLTNRLAALTGVCASIRTSCLCDNPHRTTNYCSARQIDLFSSLKQSGIRLSSAEKKRVTFFLLVER
ncbi:hypothetical protein Salat_2996400 [Sesamum alatum]|uniref:Uncharacterized protein n=1 Tax=Sesamum alatum TaxID=300844 RepID=A0AAE2C7M1_9LAMI|nr:hypothetical protein Salat_2996400 [Sesamum alatum]